MLKKISFKHIALFFTCLIFGGLILHYYQLKEIQKLNFNEELDSFYKVDEYIRPEIEKLIPQIDENTVLAFGSSSMIVPGTCDGSVVFPATFPALLGNVLVKEHLKILNLSVCGDDTKSEIGTLRFILKRKKPKAILFYTGQSDYTNAFREIAQKKMNLIDSDFFYNKLLGILPLTIKFQIDHFVKNNFESALIKMYRSLDKDLFDKNKYRQWASLINSHIERNVSQMIKEADHRGVKLVFVTPIANVLYRPVGADTELMNWYLKGMAEKNVNLLWNAADLDFFGFDQRVKTETILMFKKLASDKVMVVDLFHAPEASEFAFYEKNFVDIFHFSGAGHRWVFEKMIKDGVVDFLVRP